MSEEQIPPTYTAPTSSPGGATEPEQPQTTRPATESWQEVGRQFQALGQSLATALRMTWYDEEERRRLQTLQAGLESMAVNVGQAIKDRALAPGAQVARAGVAKAAEGARAAGATAVQEVQPHLVQALHRLNAELEKVIERVEPDPVDAAAAVAHRAAPAAPATAAAPVAPEVHAAPEVFEAPEAEKPPEKKWYEE